MDVWHTDAWLTVTQGRKRFVLFHPGQMRYVYDEKTQTFADLDAEGGLETIQSSGFPDFAKAAPIVAVVAAGETTYRTRGWPHYAVALEAGVSLTVNFLARANRHRVLEKAVAFANRRDACEALLGRAPRASDNLLKRARARRVHRDGGRREDHGRRRGNAAGEDARGEAGEAQGGGGGRG